MRAELGGIHLALERTPVDEELTILTDSLVQFTSCAAGVVSVFSLPMFAALSAGTLYQLSWSALPPAPRWALGHYLPKSVLTTLVSSMQRQTALPSAALP